VFAWLLRLFRRSNPYEEFVANEEAKSSTKPAAPPPAKASNAATSSSTTTSTPPAAAATGGTAGNEAGFSEVLAENDFDPNALGKEENVWWKPKPPIFKPADRADVAACDPDAVGALGSTIISELLASIDKVPPFPVVANKLIELSSQPDVRADLVERLVVQDPVIAAKVISAANSPFYGLANKVETVDHAIRVVGLREVSQIAIAAAAAAIFDTQERVAFEAMTAQQNAAWAHSLATARGSLWLAMWLGADVQRAYIAGLLHDIGKPVALRGIGFALINGHLMEPPSSAMAMAAVEASHTDVGAMLADAWTLGEEMASIIEGHHGEEGDSMLARIVKLASAVDEVRTNPAQRDNLIGTIVSTAQALGLNSQKVTELGDEVERAATLRV
jgi:putative nucleotidyltransferase with HDIG domain